MSDPTIRRALENSSRALERLEEGLSLPETDPNNRDVVILRFVLVFETAWKALRQCLASEQITARYPKEAFRGAFQAGWIDREELWLKMLEDRNLVAHTYNERTAIRIYEDVKSCMPVLRQAHGYLQQRFGTVE